MLPEITEATSFSQAFHFKSSFTWESQLPFWIYKVLACPNSTLCPDQLLHLV